MATITVTNSNDSGAGSLRAALASASSGDTINFAPSITTIDLASSLVIAKNVTIEGAQSGSTTPGVTINGGGSGSNFSDFVINAGVTTTFDGLIIEDGNATGVAGSTSGAEYGIGGTGSGAAGGIFDSGNLTVTNSVLQNDTATGGAGGGTNFYGAGGGGGAAAGAIYVTATASLTLSAHDSFSNNSAVGGVGGRGGAGYTSLYSGQVAGGAGGPGGVSGVNNGVGSSGTAGAGAHGGAGGAPGQAGSPGQGGGGYTGPGGGGGGGNAFANVGGAGKITGAPLVVTNESDDVNTVGSLRYDLARAVNGDIIIFASSVTTIDLSASLEITKNITIESAQVGSSTPGVTINGGGSSSNFADFIVDGGVTATFDGLIIEDGHSAGVAAANAFGSGPGHQGGGAAGGILVEGSLALTNSVLQNDTATGGAGGVNFSAYSTGGGAGGNAAGAIYVGSSGTLNYNSTNDAFSNNSAVGGRGGQGGDGTGRVAGGAGGAGGVSGVNGGLGSTGSRGADGGGAGGAPDQPGTAGTSGTPGGGGGGGTAFADIGGKGAIINDVVTNESDDVNTVGSLRYVLAHVQAGGTIIFDPSVTTIDLSSSLVITKNVTIEGAQPGPSTPGVTINGGGSGSNFSDFTIDAGVTATFDGLIIANGHATGAAGANTYNVGILAGNGHAAAGGIYDAGLLLLTNSVLQNDTAQGGGGGNADAHYRGGGAGGSAAGGIYVAGSGTLNLAASDSFSSNSATGGGGGHGGQGWTSKTNSGGQGGNGGSGGVSGVNGGVGSHGSAGAGLYGGAGGAAGQAGAAGHQLNGSEVGGPGGGGGGGNAFADVGGKGTINGPVPCYCPGTLIRTARGEKRVEKLKIGDKVMTASGMARPIKWIGRRSYAGRFVMGRKDILPVCIKAGALDENVPKRDLWISPHHAMYLDGVLIEAKDLVNGTSIVQAERVEKIEYYHVELDTHDVIIAEGAPSETYLDDDNRLLFHNAREYEALYLDEAPAARAQYCAPRLQEGYEVETARQRIALRAGLLRVADGPRIGKLRGYVDEVSARRVAGWVQTVEHPEAPVCVDIYAGGRLVGQALANRYREDLEEAGLGSGHHGFEFVSPIALSPDTIEVRRSLDGATVEFTPVSARNQMAGRSAPVVKIHRRSARA